jgi:hypothetical protein
VLDIAPFQYPGAGTVNIWRYETDFTVSASLPEAPFVVKFSFQPGLILLCFRHPSFLFICNTSFYKREKPSPELEL